MAQNSKIEWTDATWNPLAGCSNVSEGCRNCYARLQAKRNAAMGSAKYEGLTVLQGSHLVWTGKISFDEKALYAPLRRKIPTKYFVNSMSDLFHENVTATQIDQIFAIMAVCPQHTFQVLTKRPARMLAYLTRYTTAAEWAKHLSEIGEGEFNDGVFSEELECCIHNSVSGANEEHGAGWPLKNVWLGVSTEDQRSADERIPLLLQTPAAVRFISAEPLLGPMTLRVPFDGAHVDAAVGARPGIPALDWVICGGESGPDARPMHPDWARSLRDQCSAAGVAFFFKQWGMWASQDFAKDHGLKPGSIGPERVRWLAPDGTSQSCGHGLKSHKDIMITRVSKKVAGHLLDGVQHYAFPEVK